MEELTNEIKTVTRAIARKLTAIKNEVASLEKAVTTNEYQSYTLDMWTGGDVAKLTTEMGALIARKQSMLMALEIMSRQ
jgi:hypothetical protein